MKNLKKALLSVLFVIAIMISLVAFSNIMDTESATQLLLKAKLL